MVSRTGYMLWVSSLLTMCVGNTRDRRDSISPAAARLLNTCLDFGCHSPPRVLLAVCRSDVLSAPTVYLLLLRFSKRFPKGWFRRGLPGRNPAMPHISILQQNFQAVPVPPQPFTPPRCSAACAGSRSPAGTTGPPLSWWTQGRSGPRPSRPYPRPQSTRRRSGS